MFGKVSYGSLLRAFLIGVASYVIPRLLDYLDAVNATANFNFSRSAFVAFLAGVVGAGVRAVLPYIGFDSNAKG